MLIKGIVLLEEVVEEAAVVADDLATIVAKKVSCNKLNT